MYQSIKPTIKEEIIEFEEVNPELSSKLKKQREEKRKQNMEQLASLRLSRLEQSSGTQGGAEQDKMKMEVVVENGNCYQILQDGEPVLQKINVSVQPSATTSLIDPVPTSLNFLQRQQPLSMKISSQIISEQAVDYKNASEQQQIKKYNPKDYVQQLNSYEKSVLAKFKRQPVHYDPEDEYNRPHPRNRQNIQNYVDEQFSLEQKKQNRQQNIAIAELDGINVDLLDENIPLSPKVQKKIKKECPQTPVSINELSCIDSQHEEEKSQTQQTLYSNLSIAHQNQIKPKKYSQKQQGLLFCQYRLSDNASSIKFEANNQNHYALWRRNWILNNQELIDKYLFGVLINTVSQGKLIERQSAYLQFIDELSQNDRRRYYTVSFFKVATKYNFLTSPKYVRDTPFGQIFETQYAFVACDFIKDEDFNTNEKKLNKLIQLFFANMEDEQELNIEFDQLQNKLIKGLLKQKDYQSIKKTIQAPDQLALYQKWLSNKISNTQIYAEYLDNQQTAILKAVLLQKQPKNQDFEADKLLEIFISKQQKIYQAIQDINFQQFASQEGIEIIPRAPLRIPDYMHPDHREYYKEKFNYSDHLCHVFDQLVYFINEWANKDLAKRKFAVLYSSERNLAKTTTCCSFATDINENGEMMNPEKVLLFSNTFTKEALDASPNPSLVILDDFIFQNGQGQEFAKNARIEIFKSLLSGQRCSFRDAYLNTGYRGGAPVIICTNNLHVYSMFTKNELFKNSAFAIRIDEYIGEPGTQGQQFVLDQHQEEFQNEQAIIDQNEYEKYCKEVQQRMEEKAARFILKKASPLDIQIMQGRRRRASEDQDPQDSNAQNEIARAQKRKNPFKQ